MDKATIEVWLMLGTAFIANIFIYLLFRRLQKNHPQKYHVMGEPKVYHRSSIWVLLKFLIMREHKDLQDSYVTRISRILAVFLIMFILLIVLICLQ